MAYPPLPGSPTLTNPDMILPDYDRADSPDDLNPSQLTAWRTAHASPLDFHLPHSNYSSTPVQPSTPIIYGNGTMLSDIGEVTEVESTVGRRTSSRYSIRSDDTHGPQPALSAMKPMLQGRSQVAVRERRASVDSTSTITTQGHAAPFADFDDSASVDDFSCQGDDEESIASSWVDNPGAFNAQPVVKPQDQEQAHNPDRYSTTSISKRAEKILANAKRRLTTMEDNLTRARSSLNQHSPISDGSTPSPPMVRPYTGLPASAASMSSSQLKSLDESADALGPLTKPTQLTRSASALGAAGGYRQPRSSRSLDRPIEGFSRIDLRLNQLADEKDGGGWNFVNQRDEGRLSNLASPTFSAYSDASMGRLSSVSQVRDLKDQMNGLRGKISSLKEQARADSLKRRSLQSLRTPSPFTHSRWDSGYNDPQGVRSPEPEDQLAVTPPSPDKAPVVDLQVPTQALEEARLVPTSEQVGDASGVEDVLGDSAGQQAQKVDSRPEDRVGAESDDEFEDVRTEDGFGAERDVGDAKATEEMEENYDSGSDSGDSLYHDTFQAPVSHEDREDAFDYEHFFLHSAMGTISHGRFGRSGSVSSEESIETTRGPSKGHSRPQSLQTMSSVDSFATAEEGRTSRTMAYEEEEDEGEDGESDEEAMQGDENRHKVSATPEVGTDGSGSDRVREHRPPRRNSVIHRPLANKPGAAHRPSISSIGSTGTNRSFPLVSKATISGGVLTPGGSPDDELKHVSDNLLRRVADVSGGDDSVSDGSLFTLQMLGKDDQIGVERLVASLGKVVLSLGEASRASSEARLYRRRIEAARRILEGQDENYQ
ncbi:hypothetical protein S40285_00677 [Stachybotrys chlorohalonatus IBT 40285]|uniref:Uncharacterized protein n=1 Tax=Stachybotrys chlorohalonatus (strain IBT 40285) TaxID=1283841 RepID=A0A084QRE1_STAC4|nr:hypothetical protein S40285_00677 [Stachybotrys chlorohalonata IBT 40285]